VFGFIVRICEVIGGFNHWTDYYVVAETATQAVEDWFYDNLHTLEIGYTISDYGSINISNAAMSIEAEDGHTLVIDDKKNIHSPDGTYISGMSIEGPKDRTLCPRCGGRGEVFVDS
jgi:hypothetical protein